MPAICFWGVKFPENLTEVFYLHAIASGFKVKYYEHNNYIKNGTTYYKIGNNMGNTNNKK